MPKAKVKTAVKKRFRITKRGKILHKRGAISHRTSKERSPAKSRRKRVQLLSKVEKKRIKKMLNR